jgi:hypothetical protein
VVDPVKPIVDTTRNATQQTGRPARDRSDLPLTRVQEVDDFLVSPLDIDLWAGRLSGVIRLLPRRQLDWRIGPTRALAQALGRRPHEVRLSTS